MIGKLPEKEGLQQLELYLHVPFCEKKCDYCDFLSAPSNALGKAKYFEALQREIKSYKGRVKGYRVSTIFIGGGTPSCVDANYLKEALDTVREVFEICGKETIEITIEVNPGTVNRDKLMIYQEAGINRISFGLQSSLDHELRLLGRIHDYGEFLENYSLARSLGFHNINVDLMSALPGQTLSDWEITLNKVAELQPEHISAYSLIIEEGTPYYERYGAGRLGEDQLPTEDLDRLIYQRTKEILAHYGYHRYEISNYSREGYECRHNKGYWTGTPYLGLGLGASSYFGNVRFQNTSNLEEYITACTQAGKSFVNVSKKPVLSDQLTPLSDVLGIRRELQELSIKEQMEEFMYLGLRLTEGIHREEFRRRFGKDLEEPYGKTIADLKSKGLLEERMGTLYLTEHGLDVSNLVFVEFILD